MPDGALGLLAPKDPSAEQAGQLLRSLVRGLREGWRVLLGCFVGGLLLSVAALWAVPPEYTASMVVGPTARTGAAAMGARVPVPVGRETALGVAEPGAGDETLSDFARYLELLASIPVAERLMADPELVRRLFPSRWDAEAGGWRAPAGPLSRLKRLCLALVGREDWVEPDAERVSRLLHDRLLVETVRTGPMRRISLRHADRDFALRLLSAVAATTDAHLRTEAARRSAAQIAHVRARLAGITAAEHRRALADLLSEQERVAIMIEVDLPFAADPVEPPAVAGRPDWPNPAAVVPLSALAGLVAGSVFLSLRGAWQAGASTK